VLQLIKRAPAHSQIGAIALCHRQRYPVYRGTETEHRCRRPCRRQDQGLNLARQRAVAYGIGEDSGAAPPLLIAAGAGTGKTKTLAYRVARLILGGIDPRQLLLLTFTRRAALELTRRTQQILAASRGGATFGRDAELLP